MSCGEIGDRVFHRWSRLNQSQVEPLSSCDAQLGPVVDPKPKVNPYQTQANAQPELVKVSKPKLKPLWSRSVNGEGYN